MARLTAHHYHPLVRLVAKALGQRCGVVPDTSIVLGCSGGADSLALLHACSLLAPRRKWRLKLIVGHINHHLRDEAQDDAQFVEALAGKLGLAYARRDIRPADSKGNLEANARDQRYAALIDIAKEYDASLIATAHHADDQLETLLMRMLRGTSVAGLRGIAWQKTLSKNGAPAPRLIRPMLALDQSDIHSFLKQLDQPWREDATNADTSRTRAKLRHDVLPLLKAIQPDATNKASELVEHFGELYTLVQCVADEQTDAPRSGGANNGVVLLRESARAMNRAVLTELLRRALIDAGVSADRLSRHALLPAVHAAQDTTGGVRTFAFANASSLIITRDAVQLVTK